MFSGTVPFKKEHLMAIAMPDEKAFFINLCADLEKTDAVTFIYQNRVMVCGGITEYWSGRGQLWSVFNRDTKSNFVPAFRAVHRWLREMQGKYHRIELSVDSGFDIGKRRALMLGFKLEVDRARKYLPNQKDCSLFSMVRD